MTFMLERRRGKRTIRYRTRDTAIAENINLIGKLLFTQMHLLAIPFLHRVVYRAAPSAWRMLISACTPFAPDRVFMYLVT